MNRLKNIKDILEYRDGKLVNLVTKDKYLMERFLESRFEMNTDLSDGVMQLGWHSLGVFEETPAGLKVVELKQQDKKNEKMKDKIFNQVVTRAVATCTFVHIAFGRRHIIAHLDKFDLKEGYETISGLLEGVTEKIFGFCSHISTVTKIDNTKEVHKEAEEFSQKLKALCRSGGYADFNRFGAEKLCGHMEIGLSSESDGLHLFGDVMYFVKNTKVQEVPAFCFESQDQLMRFNIQSLFNTLGLSPCVVC